MLDNDLQVIRESQKFRYEDILRSRRGYDYYSDEKFARGKALPIGVRAQRFLSTLGRRLQLPQSVLLNVDCVFNPTEC